MCYLPVLTDIYTKRTSSTISSRLTDLGGLKNEEFKSNNTKYKGLEYSKPKTNGSWWPEE